MSGFSKVKVRLDKLCGVPDWTFHDLRRTAATGLAQLKIAPHVTEKIINHTGTRTLGPMARIYQRYDYLDERRDALSLWGKTVTRLVNKVVRFKAS